MSDDDLEFMTRRPSYNEKNAKKLRANIKAGKRHMSRLWEMPKWKRSLNARKPRKVTLAKL